MPVGPTLTSIHNPAVGFARSLQQRRVRYRERALLAEGTRLVIDCLRAGAKPTIVFVAEDQGDALLPQLDSLAPGATIYPVSRRVLGSLADTATPQGVVAVFPFPQRPLRIPPSEAALLVIAEAVRDPGNLGTLIRAALGAGAHGLLVPPETADPFSPKVMRAGMGAQFRLPILALDWDRPPAEVGACDQRLAAEVDGDVAYDRVDWTLPSCLLVGNEAHGIGRAAREHTTGSVSIPLAGALESLNAAVAGSVILFEAARQRRSALEARPGQ